jgi:hypothetical protein
MSDYNWGTKQTVKERLGIAPETLKTWRLGKRDRPPVLVEGIHWVYISSRAIRYNVRLLEDFMVNRATPELHEIAIEHYLGSLPSSQRPKHSRRSKNYLRAV